MVGLVHERQGELREVDDVDVLERVVVARAPGEPVGHRQPDAAGPGAGDDDLEGRHRSRLPGARGATVGSMPALTFEVAPIQLAPAAVGAFAYWRRARTLRERGRPGAGAGGSGAGTAAWR